MEDDEDEKRLVREISQLLMQFTGKSAQTKWRNIRDSYVKHLKSLQTTEPAYRKYRNWQWVDQMSFLKKFLGGNKQLVNSIHFDQSFEQNLMLSYHLENIAISIFKKKNVF